MDTIVTDVTPESLYAASHEHFMAYVMYCAQAPDGLIHDTPELAWGISGAPSAWMNGVVRTRLEEDSDADDVIAGVLDQARQRSVSMGWFLLPGTTPEGMGEKLIAHGMKYHADDPGMAVDLHRLPDEVPASSNLTIEEVLDRPTLQTWVSVWAESYGADETKRQRRFDFRASQGLDPELPYRSYLGYWDGKPVATAELFLGAGVAAIVWVGTVPDARRKGIGAAITLEPLLEARRLGYQIGALMATPLGYPVYQALGFEEHCRIPTYTWVPGG